MSASNSAAKPRTPAQQEASRQNGRRSRGPVTAEGKNKIRFNALQHGLTGKFVLLSDEDRTRWEIHWTSILETFQPVNDLEFLAVEEYAWAKWRYRRSLWHERGVIEQQRVCESPTLDKVQRHTIRCRREADAALREFERLVSLRDRGLIDVEEEAPALKPTLVPQNKPGQNKPEPSLPSPTEASEPTAPAVAEGEENTPLRR